LHKQPVLVSTEYWKPYTDDAPNVLWLNKEMKICAFEGCGFADADAEDILAHYVRVHGRIKKPDEAEPEEMAEQGKLTGGKVSREDRMAEILLALPKERLRCAYCFCDMDSKAARQFNEDGRLLKTAKCISCGKTMELSTMRMMRDPIAFGKFIGEYKGWWFKVSHDEWMAGLKKVYWQKAAMEMFWQGYAQGSPKFAERRRIEAAGGNVELAKARQDAAEKKEGDDEMAKYKRPDGSVDWDKMAEDAKAHMQGRLADG
jgi:hypothetical protein